MRKSYGSIPAVRKGPGGTPALARENQDPDLCVSVRSGCSAAASLTRVGAVATRASEVSRRVGRAGHVS